MEALNTTNNFPAKLFYLLEIMENKSPSVSPIRWNEDGKSFRVNQKKEFCLDIIPRYFKQKKFTSFTRQLNIYGFKQIRHGSLHGSYYHPMFRRGQKGLLLDIIRVPVKSNPAYLPKKVLNNKKLTAVVSATPAPMISLSKSSLSASATTAAMMQRDQIMDSIVAKFKLSSTPASTTPSSPMTVTSTSNNSSPNVTEKTEMKSRTACSTPIAFTAPSDYGLYFIPNQVDTALNNSISSSQSVDVDHSYSYSYDGYCSSSSYEHSTTSHDSNISTPYLTIYSRNSELNPACSLQEVFIREEPTFFFQDDDDASILETLLDL